MTTRKGLPNDVKELQKLLAAAQEQLAATERKAEIAQQQVVELTSTVSEQKNKLDRQEKRIAELIAALRGKTREAVDPDQLLLFEMEELEQLLEEHEQEEKQARRSRKKHGRRRIPDGLPEEEVVHSLPEEERLCPHDGQPMPFIRYEISKQLDYIPAQFKVIVHKRAVYACPAKHDEATLAIAPKPPQPIEKGLAAPGLLAAVLVAKFGDHLPVYRQEDIFSRHGIDIRRSTIYGWLSGAADLVAVLVALMTQRVLKSKVIHTDDTQVKLIDHDINGTVLARYWTYVGDHAYPYTVYDFTRTRGRDGPQKFLKDYSGYLHADAYSAYDGIYLDSHGEIIEVACWAHCRRYWWKLREQDPERASYVLSIVKRLYDVEKLARDQTSEQRRELRQTQSAPLLQELKVWLDKQRVLPKSNTGEALTYTLNQWDALNRYLEDGDLAIDNNISERSVKPIAIGRKNWLFVGSEEAGRRAGLLMSLIASCKANRVEPWHYLKDVFTRLPLPETDLESLLPDRWLEDNPKHRWNIADQRAEERIAKGDL